MPNTACRLQLQIYWNLSGQLLACVSWWWVCIFFNCFFLLFFFWWHSWAHFCPIKTLLAFIWNWNTQTDLPLRQTRCILANYKFSNWASKYKSRYKKGNFGIIFVGLKINKLDWLVLLRIACSILLFVNENMTKLHIVGAFYAFN